MFNPLSAIVVLYRQPDTMALWGLPYDMRPGQSPRDLMMRTSVPMPLPGWIYMGSPGWWGNIPEADRKAIVDFLDKHKANVPDGPGDWDRIGS